MNKRIITIFLITILATFHIYAKSAFKDIVVTEKYICGLTSNGSIKFYDKQTGQLSDYTLKYNKDIQEFTIDKLGNIVIIDKDNSIKKYVEQNQTWELIKTVKENLYGILFDSKNQCYGITENGILNIQTNKTYYSSKSLNHQIHYKNKWGKPYCYYIDKSDKIWLGFGYGEWGGNLFVFETVSNNFLTPKLDTFNIALWPIKSFFEDNEYTYLSSGLQHFTTSGIIIKFDNLKASTLLESDTKNSKSSVKDSTNVWTAGEYIGPSTYNKFNNSIYFYSQNGIFKGEISKDLSQLENWENILKPKLHWESGQRDAIGSPMNVLKLIIVDKDKFVFLTQNDGIGFYNGKKLIILN
ncbi:MAG: hypothetical protein LBN95_04385 [Prevotellaceae bacterium]|jgi:hypothetical protein|nr:hypothetical protein [Prevotellaceae bacterium]